MLSKLMASLKSLKVTGIILGSTGWTKEKEHRLALHAFGDSFMNFVASKNIWRQSLVAYNYNRGQVIWLLSKYYIYACPCHSCVESLLSEVAIFVVIFVSYVSWSDSQCPLKTTISVSLHAGSSWFGATYSGWSGSQRWIPSREHGAG